MVQKTYGSHSLTMIKPQKANKNVFILNVKIITFVCVVLVYNISKYMVNNGNLKTKRRSGRSSH